jgi:hypothetical protein
MPTLPEYRDNLTRQAWEAHAKGDEATAQLLHRIATELREVTHG